VADNAYRVGRKLAPGIVRIRLEGKSAAGLAARLAEMEGVSVLTGPDEYPNGRLYLTVALAGEGKNDAER
jgi:hypothetical protein